MFIQRSAQLIGNAVANHMALYPPSEPTLAYLQDACRLVLHVDWTEDWFQTEIVDIEWDFTAQCATEAQIDHGEFLTDLANATFYPHTEFTPSYLTFGSYPHQEPTYCPRTGEPAFHCATLAPECGCQVTEQLPACRYCGHRSAVHEWYGSAPFCGAQCIDAFETWVAEPF